MFNELVDESKLELLTGSFPQSKNEIVLVVGETKRINDSMLYALGLRNKADLAKDFVFNIEWNDNSVLDS